MDTLVTIFGQLGLDSSFFVQITIASIVLFASHFVFMDKLKFVVENRLDKTERLQKLANDKEAEALQLSESYQHKISSAQDQAYSDYNAKKLQLVKKHEDELKVISGQVQDEVDEAQEAYKVELGEKRKNLMDNADQLANLLVSKISQ